MCYRNGQKMLCKLLKFLPQLIICMCILVSMVQAFLAHEKNDLNESADFLEQNATHRKGRCRFIILFCLFFCIVLFSKPFQRIFQRRMLSLISFAYLCSNFHFRKKKSWAKLNIISSCYLSWFFLWHFISFVMKLLIKWSWLITNVPPVALYLCQ